MSIRLMTPGELPRLREFWTQQWGADFITVHGETIRYNEVEGFIFGEWKGVATFLVRGEECEVTSLDSLEEGKGIGKALLSAILREAKDRGCKRLFLITTNDNLKALRLYQKFGFELCALRCGAITETRKAKPAIPLIGLNGIPLRDELELEMTL